MEEAAEVEGVVEVEDDAAVVMALGFGRVLVCTVLDRSIDSMDCATAAGLDSHCYCRSPSPRNPEGCDNHRTPSFVVMRSWPNPVCQVAEPSMGLIENW
jgi:hypothetical protein